MLSRFNPFQRVARFDPWRGLGGIYTKPVTVEPSRIAQNFVEHRIAPSRGWKNVEVIDAQPADLHMNATWDLVYTPEVAQASDPTTREKLMSQNEARLASTTVYLSYQKPNKTESEKEISVVVDKVTGKVLKVIMDYQHFGPTDFPKASK